MSHDAKKRLHAGDQLGRYEIARLIGTGGMGEVYLARDKTLDRNVAIKVLNEKYESDQSNIQRFVQEAKAASALNHPNILTIHEVGKSKESHFIVSEYIEGQTLREVLGKRKLELTEVLNITIQVAGALAAAHAARIIHRDVKPENIIVRSDGYVKVLDFGLAKLIPEQPSLRSVDAETIRQNQTAAGLILGTVNYMSPEQARCERLDARSDIFSLGSVLYEMLTGRKPFEAASQAEMLAAILVREPPPLTDKSVGITPELQRVVSRMLAKDRDDRYPTMKHVIGDLKLCQNGPVLNSSRETATELLELSSVPVPAPRPRRNILEMRRILIISSGVLVVIAAALFALSFRNPGTSQNAVNIPPRSPAYDLYIRGKVKASADNREDVEGAIRVLEQAVAVDPNYAEAYASLAIAYNQKAFFLAEPSEKKLLGENSEVAVEKALALNPNLAEGHFARGRILWTHEKRFPHELAIQALRQAIQLNPNYDEAHHRLGMVYAHIGLFDQADKEIRRALEINPNNTMARFRSSTIYRNTGNYEAALNILKTVPTDVSPSLITGTTAEVLMHLNRTPEARTLVDDYLQRYPKDEGGLVTSWKAVLLAMSGKRTEAETLVRQAIEIGRGFGHFHHTAYNIALVYAALNDPEEAVKWLRDAADDGFPCYPAFERDNFLDEIRNYPGFIDFMAELKPTYEKRLAEYGQ